MLNDREPTMWRLLRSMGCRKSGDSFVLDGFDSDFYLRFDVGIDTDHPALSERTCDIHVMPVGACPSEVDRGMRVVTFAREMHVMRFMFALGVERFSEKTRTALYENNRPIRLHEQKVDLEREIKAIRSEFNVNPEDSK